MEQVKIQFLKWKDKLGLPKLLLALLAGVFLLVTSLPAGEKKEVKEERGGSVSEKEATLDEMEAESVAQEAMAAYGRQQEERLKAILEKVDGVGRVDVMITLAASEERKTLQNEESRDDYTREGDSVGGERINESTQTAGETVLIQSEEGQRPYVVQITSPQIQGIVIVAQGADRAAVHSEIIQAAQALFSVESHKIKVMKRKN